MNAVYMLWKKRIGYLIESYYKFIRFQIDWVIVCYSVLLVGGLIIINLEAIPKLSHFIQNQDLLNSLYPVFVVYLLFSGRYATYLKSADEVFLSPLHQMGKRFIKYSFILNTFANFVKWAFVSLIAFLLYKGLSNFSIKEYGVFFLWTGFVKLAFINGKFMIKQVKGKWKRRFLSFVFYTICLAIVPQFIQRLLKGNILAGAAFLHIVFIVFLWIFTIFVIGKIRLDWENIIKVETDIRTKHFSFLIGSPPERKGGLRKKTFSFFSGVHIIPFSKKGALDLLYFRKLTRNTGNLKILLQFIGFALGAVFVATEPLVFVIGSMLIIFLMADFLVSTWNEIKDFVWFNIYPFSKKQKKKVMFRGPLLIIGGLFSLISLGNTLVNGAVINPILDIGFILIWAVVTVEIQNYVFMFKNKGKL